MNIKIDIDADDLIRDVRAWINNSEDIVAEEMDICAHKIQRTAVELAPIDTGELRRSIAISGGGLEYEIGTNLYYAYWMEEGTGPHVITGNPWLFWPGASHPVRSVMHPGTNAYRYMQRALEANTRDLDSRIGDALVSKF